MQTVTLGEKRRAADLCLEAEDDEVLPDEFSWERFALFLAITLEEADESLCLFLN